MSSVTLLLPLTLPCFRSLWWGYIWVWKTDLRGQSDHLTVNHAGVSAAVCLNQLSVDGSIHQLKLQLIWSRVSVAHGQLLTAYAHQQEERWSRLQTHTHTQHNTTLSSLKYRQLHKQLQRFVFLECVYSSLTNGRLSAHADLQHGIKDLKQGRLLMVGQKQDRKVHLRSGVFAVRH